MSDTLTNALAQAGRSSSVLSGIANPAVVNPLAGYGSAISAVQGIQDLQQRQQTLSQSQQTQQLQKLNYTAGTLADLLNQPGQITSDQVRGAAMQHVGDGITDENTVNQVLSTMPQNTADNPNAVRGWVRQLQIANLGHQQQIMAGFNPVTYTLGGTAVTRNEPTMPGVGGANAPAYTQATTPTPGEYMAGAGITYQATQADVDAGLKGPDGKPVHIGQSVTIPQAEVYRRAGIPIPPGLGQGGGGGVVNADGTRASPASPPRLLNVPMQPSNSPPPPAPTGGPPAPLPVGGNVGIGAALARPQGAPAATLPVPPVPPTATPPAPPSGPAPIWNPNNPVGTSAVTPSTANPAIAAAQAQARATRQPVPVPGVPGMVANPDGSVGPPGGSGFPRPALPPNAPQASLQGGVPVASVNALAPNLGAPSPPSPLVPGDVNAIMAGMNARRGAPPTQGTQTAFNTIATGPGTEEAQGYKTSADKLAADNVAAANFQATQFPYVQALKTYGEGTKTGPTSDFWNQVAGTIRTPLAKLGLNIGNLDDNTQRQDALGKWLANIQSGNPLSGKSDAELAQVLKGSASTHINETTGADMVKAGLSLQRMNVAATREWNNNPALQQQYGTYLNYLGNYNTTTDPRAFAVDTYNPAQIARLRTQLQNGSEADAQRFETSLALARRNGVIGGAGSQAMP